MDQVQNFIKEVVNGAHVLADTTVNVVDASLFPDPASGEYNLTWWDATNYPDPADDPLVEIVRVTARDTGLNTLTVTRAQEGTSASDKNTGGATYLLALCPTKKTMDDIDSRVGLITPASSSAPASINLAEDTDNGTNKITITAPSAIASDKVLTLPDATDTLVGKDTTDTLTNKILSTAVKLDANADQNITQYGMARQAIMNGNFDVWQRGTSVAIADVTLTLQADRWGDRVDKNGGTLPTLTRSRQLLTAGDIAGAFYYTRLATNGAGTSLGVSSYGRFEQKIENGTRNLCGLDKKVTVSFWAKSDIDNKRICPTLLQRYGTGGSPSALEPILGTLITLTSTWTKYTATFTTNTLVGKTFGTAGDDYLELDIYYMWGTTVGNTYVQTSVTAETFVGSGNIDIAQVQLCSGDVALPFQPKSYEEELRACQRYYQGVYINAVATTTGYAPIGQTFTPVLRKSPTSISMSSTVAGTANQINAIGVGTIDVTSAIVSSTAQGIDYINKTGVFTAGRSYVGYFIADAEL